MCLSWSTPENSQQLHCSFTSLAGHSWLHLLHYHNPQPVTDDIKSNIPQPASSAPLEQSTTPSQICCLEIMIHLTAHRFILATRAVTEPVTELPARPSVPAQHQITSSTLWACRYCINAINVFVIERARKLTTTTIVMYKTGQYRWIFKITSGRLYSICARK